MWRPSITFSRIFGVFLSGMFCGYVLSVIFAENPHFQQIHCHPLIHIYNGENGRNETLPAQISAGTDQPVESGRLDPRIFCFIVTSPKFESRAKMINATWAPRCDKYLFMSSANDSTVPTVALPLGGQDSRQQLWNKAKLTYRYIYEHHLDQFDWFFKGDTDTYAVVENMRLMVSSLNTSVPYFLGRRFKGFVSGGSGYLMTAATIRLLVEKGIDTNFCDQLSPKADGQTDDVIISVCLDKLGAVFGDTRDSLGRQRFMPFSLEDAFSNAPFTFWVKAYDFYPYQDRLNCCSDTSVSFHYVKDHQLEVYEFMTRHLRTQLTRQEMEQRCRRLFG